MIRRRVDAVARGGYVRLDASWVLGPDPRVVDVHICVVVHLGWFEGQSQGGVLV